MEFKPSSSKNKGSSLIDVTFTGNPPPQASSTLEKKSNLGSWEVRRASQEENKTRRSLLNNSDAKQMTVNSSLGILDNISSLLGDSGVMEERQSSNVSSKIDTERELARKLLQRCSEPRRSSTFSDQGKENDVNLQNLSRDYTPSTLIDSGQQSFLNRSEALHDEEHPVIFKSTEISARSSALNASFNKSCGSITSPSRAGGISFDTTAAAELMAQFGDEEFQSGSRVGSRMLADELSWNQNYSYAMPANVSSTGDKERLELSCFSGIVGDFDLSLESYAGRKVSVGEFFQRKCGNIGQLHETDTGLRPSFGVSINSPMERESIVPLANETIMSEEPSIKEGQKTATESVNSTKQHSLMSLSTIAQVLQDIENGSPRRLVDQLIQAKRKKKFPPSQLVNANANSFVHPAEGSFNLSSLSQSERPERDAPTTASMSLLNSPRLSLDSKLTSDASQTQSKSTRMSLNIASETPESRKASNTYTADLLKERLSAERESNVAEGKEYFNEQKKSKKSSIYHSNITRNLLFSLDDSLVTHGPNVKVQHAEGDADIPGKTFYQNRESSHISKASQDVLPQSRTFHKTDSLPVQSPGVYSKSIKHENDTLASPGLRQNYDMSVKESLHNLSEDVKTNNKEMSSIEHDTKLESGSNVLQLQQHKKIKSNGNIVSARNTTELFSCIVGVPREAEIEVLNGSDRWMTCTLTLHQIQGSTENIVLTLPDDTILVEPDRGKLIKIGVNVRQMRKPVIAVINIAVSDMVTRSSGVIKHVMCFVPEEPQIGVILHYGEEAIDFQFVAEKCSKTFPMILENKNNAELPLRIMILKHPDEPQIFSIDSLADEVTDTVNTHNGIKYNLMLKPHQQSTVNIRFNGIPLAAFNNQKGQYHATGKLMIQLRTDDAEGLLLKEISLNGCIAVSKIDLVDTALPIVVTKKENKSITLLNSGDLAVLLSVSLVENDKSTSSAGDFSLKPNTLFLQSGEKGVILLSYKSRSNDSSERQVLVKVAAGGNEYYYPAVADGPHLSDYLSANDVQRCGTPQSRQISSPGSPHSTTSNRSGNSGRHSPASAASTSTVSGDVIPIQSTHAALVWSSVKTGRTDVKEFTILNKSENKIKLQVNIVDKNKSFKFLKDRSTVGSMLLVLQRMGSKEISVSFSPTNPGACAGKIIFTHYNNIKETEESSQRKTIFLYGYAGVGKIEISQAFKDTGGLMWLSLGHMNPRGTLSAKIKLQNTGDLCSYAIIKLTPKALYPAMISSWHIHPTELLLGPGEIQWVELEFHPRREDLALLQRADVSHVGTITITHGDEPTRWRIRRLFNKLKETGKLKGAENDTFRTIVVPLCKAFPGEALIQDLSLIKDSVQHLGDLCRGVSQHQVMLTMEINADETMTMLNDNADDTQMFYSVCSDSSSIFISGCDSYMPSETITDGNGRGSAEGDFTVTPAVVTLAPPFRTEATVTVSSLCSVAQPFETILSHRDGLSVVPTEGMIPAGRSFPLKVQCSREINTSLTAVLQIFMENHKREILITVSSKN